MAHRPGKRPVVGECDEQFGGDTRLPACDQPPTVECSYTAGKDGVLKVKLTGHEGKHEIKKKLKEVLPVNTEFTFKWTVDGDTPTADNLEGKDVEGLKSHVEGKYEKK